LAAKCLNVKNGKKKVAFTLNGSGVATARVWLSIIETYQQPDGSVKVPDVLVPFMGREAI
jgi:seryl-tRNA synthetase